MKKKLAFQVVCLLLQQKFIMTFYATTFQLQNSLMRKFLYKDYILRNGIPILVAFLFMTLIGDSFILPFIFQATDNGNLNLFVWIIIDAVMLFLIFFATRYVLYFFGLIDNWRGKIPRMQIKIQIWNSDKNFFFEKHNMKTNSRTLPCAPESQHSSLIKRVENL